MDRMLMLAELLRQAGTAGVQNPSSTSRSLIQLARDRAERLNHEPGKLVGYDCAECQNRGYFFTVDEQGRQSVRHCRCMIVRRNRELLRRSGLEDMVQRYTLDNWQEREGWQRQAKRQALSYAEHPEGWFVMAGSVGAGKTHLCTALCGMLMERGVETRYVLWRDMSVRAKAVVNDEAEYQRLVEPLKRVKALYIDDLYKTGKGQEPSAADVSLAFELLNSRYNDARLLTIISTERTLEELMSIDEAVGSRIYERAKGNYIPLHGRANWRLT